MRRRRMREKRDGYDQDASPFAESLDKNLLSFTSTRAEIRRAVERSSIQRGVFLINNLIHLDYETLLQQVDMIVQSYDKEVWQDQATALRINVEALSKLDNLLTPVP